MSGDGARRTVALVAFACDPRLPSEPTIGWEYLLAWRRILDDEPDVDVIAFMNLRSSSITQQTLSEQGLVHARLSIVGVGLPSWAGRLTDPRLTRLEYLVWSQRTSRRIAELLEGPGLTLVRHLTFASELLPTPITVARRRATTVWGPVGSTGEARAYLVEPRAATWRRQMLVQRLRDLVSRTASRRTARKVDLTLTTSAELRDGLRGLGAAARVFPNTRLDEDLLRSVESVRLAHGAEGPREAGAPLRILCVGNLIALKRQETVIAALADRRLSRATLRLVGKPLDQHGARLRQVAERYGVTDRVIFVGQVPRHQVLEEMAAADVLAHPSAREGASGAVGEATAVGLPVVCFAGTGAAAVLAFAGSQGVEVRAEDHARPGLMADALLRAAALPRTPSDVWFEDRYLTEERRLLDDASEGRR